MANALSGLALLVSIGALAVSWLYGARSANSARESADDARKVRKAELEREHRDYPPVLGDLEFVWETNPRTNKPNQFMTFRLSRTYRVFGDAVNDNDSRSPLGNGMGGAFESGTIHRIFVSDDINPPKAVELRFFPPVDGDPGETWSCPCDRDAVPDVQKKGHWVVQEVVPPQPEVMVRWA
jgi:hypothetical protein